MTCISESQAAERLAKLIGRTFGAESFSEPTRGAEITSAEMRSSDRDGSIRYVDVKGIIRPFDRDSFNIEWEVLLPLNWNGRTVQVGGGANCGFIPKLHEAPVLCEDYPIDLGYVVYGDDSGHQSVDPMDADFAKNEESLKNYIRLHLIKAREMMEKLVNVFYGCKPVFNFFVGGSAGGREALECALHYGEHYDAIFCAAPVASFVLTRMWGAILSRAVYKNYDAEKHPFSDGFIDEETVKAIQRDAIQRYDGLDGLENGMVCNIFAARAGKKAFREEIREKYHLTDAQMETIDVYEDGFKLDYAMPNGLDRYCGYSALEGGMMDLGPDPVPREPLDTKYNVHHGDRSDGMFKYFITKDPTWKLIDHDYYHPDEKLREDLMRASREYDVNDPDLDQFVNRGGKLILFGGWNDMSMSPWQLIEQYKSYRARYGQEKLDEFCRFYLMPGVVHCFGAKMKYITWLDQWRTTGKYPDGPLDAYMHHTDGRLPMARFPGWVKYRGGDPKESRNYEISYEIPESIMREL